MYRQDSRVSGRWADHHWRCGTGTAPGPLPGISYPAGSRFRAAFRVVQEVSLYQMASGIWTGITASVRLPALPADPPSTTVTDHVNGAVLPSSGPVSPATRSPPAKAFPSGSVASGPTGPEMIWSRGSSTGFSATLTRFNAAFSLRSCCTPHRGQVQYASRPSSPLWSPQSEHSLPDGKKRSASTMRVSYQFAL